MGNLRFELPLACRRSYHPERGIERIEPHKLQKRTVHVGCILDLYKLRRKIPLAEPDHIHRSGIVHDLRVGEGIDIFERNQTSQRLA